MPRSPFRILAAVSTAAALLSTPAFAVELNDRWKVGDVHRFTYEDDTAFEMDMGGMPGMGAMGQMMPGMSGPGMTMGGGGMKVRAKVTTTFSEKVLAVRPDGTADIQLTVEKMQISAGGAKAAVLSQLPPAARVIKAEVDKKGHARFYDMVTVYVQDEQMYVGVHKVSASAKGGTMTASASAGGQTVTLVAAVNPKTGTVTASASVKADAPPPPALKKVEIREDAQQVEVLPQQIFALMVLPDGDLPEGGRVAVKTPIGEVASTVESLKLPVAKVHLETASEMKTAAPTGPSDEDEGDEESGAQMNAAKAMANTDTRVDVDARYEFDVTAGKLLSISGKLHSDMSMGGMGMKSSTDFSLKRM